MRALGNDPRLVTRVRRALVDHLTEHGLSVHDAPPAWEVQPDGSWSAMSSRVRAEDGMVSVPDDLMEPLDDGAYMLLGTAERRPGAIPVDAYPYVVVHLGAGDRLAVNEAADPGRVLFDLQTTSVALTVRQADWIAGAVSAALAGAVIDGSHQVVSTGAQPIRADDTLPDRRVLYATAQWSLRPTR